MHVFKCLLSVCFVVFLAEDEDFFWSCTHGVTKSLSSIFFPSSFHEYRRVQRSTDLVHEEKQIEKERRRRRGGTKHNWFLVMSDRVSSSSSSGYPIVTHDCFSLLASCSPPVDPFDWQADTYMCQKDFNSLCHRSLSCWACVFVTHTSCCIDKRHTGKRRGAGTVDKVVLVSVTHRHCTHGCPFGTMSSEIERYNRVWDTWQEVLKKVHG